MNRSFSLAPGGWVGDTPGRSGDTWIRDYEVDSKYFILLCFLITYPP